MRQFPTIAALLFSLTFFIGCEQEVPTAATQPQQQPGGAPVPSTSGPPAGARQAQSSLGKAKQGAQNIVGEMEQQSQELADQIDNNFKDQ